METDASVPTIDRQQTLFAEVILPFSLAKTFTYRVPHDWNNAVDPGQRVVVPFGKNKFYAGILWRLSNRPPEAYAAKYLHSLLDEIPLLQAIHLRFWNWLASYYLCNLGDVMAAALPAGLKLASETLVMLHPEADLNNVELSDHELQLVEELHKTEALTLDEIQEITGLKHVFPIIKSLYIKGLVLTGEEIKQRFKPRFRSMIQIQPNLNEEALGDIFNKLEKRAPKQVDVLTAFLGDHPDNEWQDRLKFIKRHQLSSAAVKALIEKEILTEKEVRVDRISPEEYDTQQLKLSVEQEQAVTSTLAFWQERKPVLLHGITGSGKSFVFFHFIQKALEQQQQVLYLLPEIALTVQLVQKLRQHFGSAVFITHSRFNENERVEVFQKVASGMPCVVIAARSGIFLPFVKLGLLVIDEEHDSSYKQYDPAPRYQARDAAIYLAHLHNAHIILGSATPSLESYHNAQLGKFGLVELDNRYGDSSLPDIRLINLSDLKRKKAMLGSFSPVLMEELEAGYKEGLQSILMQNRKGYVPIITCTNCGWNAKCVSCDISMTYYKTHDHLKCNYCGFTQKPHRQCTSCGSSALEMEGFGTERIEEELGNLMPEARISRFDQDTTRGKYAHHRLVHEFEDGEVDIMVGTQMISKGLDFSHLHLVGVIQADQLLNFPNFRSFERAFQLLTQVAGRSGRREQKGLVMIQTHKPDHPVLQDVVANNYLHFYEQEILEREKFNYPPFCRLIEIEIKSKEEIDSERGAAQWGVQLKQEFGHRVLGPEKPYISRLRNYYIRRLIIKLEKDGVNLQAVKSLLIKHLIDFYKIKANRKVIVHFDVDPV